MLLTMTNKTGAFLFTTTDAGVCKKTLLFRLLLSLTAAVSAIVGCCRSVFFFANTGNDNDKQNRSVFVCNH